MSVLRFLLALSVAWIYAELLYGFSTDPWATWFFPSELSVFILGALGYRCVIPFSGTERRFSLLKYLIFVGIIVVVSLLVNNFGRTNQTTLLVIVPLIVFGLIVTIPSLFILTKNSVLDKYL